jgi:hypothetical protein
MTSELQVFNNYTDVNGGYLNADGFFVSSYIYDATGFYLLQFDLWDFSGTALNSLDIPSQSQLVKLAANGRLFIRRFEGGIETGLASGNFSAFSPISSIPEPETYAMMLGGLSVLGFVLRRRKFKDNI